MSKFFANRISACNLIAAVLLIVLLVLHFTPFWQYGENQELTNSIQGYIWFPSDNNELSKYIGEATGAEHDLNSILAMPILVLVLGAVGAVVCLLRHDQLWAGILPAVCGCVGAWGYLTKAAYQLGTNWVLHLVVCIALIVVGAAALYFGYKDKKEI